MSYCCVPNCFRNFKNDSEIVRFFRFPARNKDQLELWLIAIKKTGVDGKPWKPSKYSKICSDHFKNGTTSPIWYHPSYVPTIFPLQHTTQPCLHVGLFLDFPIVGVQDESGVGIMSLLDEQYVEEGRSLSVHWDHDYSKPSFETGKKFVGSAFFLIFKTSLRISQFAKNLKSWRHFVLLCLFWFQECSWRK